MVQADANTTVSSVQFKLFTVLWAIATLFHMAYANVFTMKLNYVLLSVAALFVIFKPGSVKGLLLVMVFQLYDVFYLLPGVNNHWLFTGFVNLTILQTLVFLMVKKQSFQIDTGKWFRTFAPIVRIEVFILYFYAVFHKLNTDFLNPNVSCATDLLKSQNIPFLPLSSTLFVLSGYFTLFIEAAIPVLLYFSKTRRVGILIGVVFHSVLAYSSYNGYFDFSSMMLALYFLFTSRGFTVYIMRQWKRLRTIRFLNQFSVRKVVFIGISGLAGFILLHLLVKRLPDFKDFNLYIFWLIYNLTFLYFIVRYTLKRQRLTYPGQFTLAHNSFWLLPLIIFFNGYSPYLGLKTESSFSMFSNLRTEAGVTNHYLVPASLQIFDFQKAYVQITSSSDPFLQKIADEKKMMVLFHFKDYIHTKSPQRVEYILNDKKEIYSLNGQSTRKLEKPPYILKKILSFRLFTNGSQACGH